VQVDPIKPMLKPPGPKRSRLKCDEPLSKMAFKFKLRRYTKEPAAAAALVAAGGDGGAAAIARFVETRAQGGATLNPKP